MLALVMAGAAVGALGRWLVGRLAQYRLGTAFPWGTLTVNVVGSLALGALLAVAAADRFSAQSVALFGTGVCGGFTTFSSFGYETVRLAQDPPGGRARALANVVANLALGLAAALAGWYGATALL
mgnify:CR=1 FL=1